MSGQSNLLRNASNFLSIYVKKYRMGCSKIFITGTATIVEVMQYIRVLQKHDIYYKHKNATPFVFGI